MFNFIYRRKLLQITFIRHSTETTANVDLPFLRNPLFSKSFSLVSSSIKIPDQTSFTVSYLINSCGLSPESALSASRKIQLKTPKTPDSILAFFKTNGFAKAHITKIITKYPELLLAKIEKTLRPKMDFFNESGISRAVLVNIIASNPSLLKRSTRDHLIPSFNFLKGCFNTHQEFVAALTRSTQVLQYNLHESVLPNISILRDHGVPESWISKVIAKRARMLSLQPNRFREILKTIDRMGFHCSTGQFIVAMYARTSMSMSTWERKMQVYRSLGWSDDDIFSAFKKQPFCMTLSEKKIRNIFDFFINKMGMEVSIICRYPNVLLLSLKNRIIPRFAVMEVLVSKGVIKQYNLSTVLQSSELYFLRTYVTKYREEIPEVLMAYHEKMDKVRLKHGSEEAGRTVKL